jgi:fructose-1,6-bisphosphatase/inositol monophosphatase family enzyme
VTVTGLPVSHTGRRADDAAREAARVAAGVTLARFRALASGSPVKRTAKGRGNYVTETDLAVEAAVMDLLGAEFPEIRFLSEETASSVEDWDRGWLWVMDPIDGTANFARGIPTFVFSLALCLDGQPVVGVTRHPVTDDEFFSVAGGGLLVNGGRALVSQAPSLAGSLMGIGLGYEYERAKKLLGLLADLWPGIQMVQNIGCAALGLAYAASGRFDIYAHSFLYPWDVAAGILHVREGGGLVTARDGGPITLYSEGIVAGAPAPVQEFVRLTSGRQWR